MALNTLKASGAVNSFSKKARLLGIEIEEQVKMLNKLYNNKLEFFVDESSITLKLLDNTVNILEIPELEHLNTKRLMVYTNHKLNTLKLPKSLKEVYFSIPYNTGLIGIHTIFMWDTTKIYNFEDFNRLGVKMLIIQSTRGKKPLVYKF